jgi:hypothetical protein
MQSTVWFTDLSARLGNSLIDKTGALLRAAGIRERTGKLSQHSSVSPAVDPSSAEELGLGTRDYRLETL